MPQHTLDEYAARNRRAREQRERDKVKPSPDDWEGLSLEEQAAKVQEHLHGRRVLVTPAPGRRQRPEAERQHHEARAPAPPRWTEAKRAAYMRECQESRERYEAAQRARRGWRYMTGTERVGWAIAVFVFVVVPVIAVIDAYITGKLG